MHTYPNTTLVVVAPKYSKMWLYMTIADLSNCNVKLITIRPTANEYDKTNGDFRPCRNGMYRHIKGYLYQLWDYINTGEHPNYGDEYCDLRPQDVG